MAHGEARKKLVDRYDYWGTVPLADWRAITRVVALEELPGTNRAWDLDAYAQPEDVVFDPRKGLYRIPPGLADAVATALAARDDARSQLLRGQLLMGLAHLDAYLGEMADARARTRDALAAFLGASLHAADPVRDDDARYYDYGYAYGQSGNAYAARRAKGLMARASELASALDARDGSPRTEFDATSAGRELELAHRATTQKDPTALEALARRDSRELNRKLWDLALGDDGAGLATRLEERGLDGRGVVDFLAARPALAPELGRWVRYGYPMACTTCGIYPLANQIASRRDAARAVGAKDVTGETTAAARRLRALLLRRDIAIPLAVISELSPP